MGFRLFSSSDGEGGSTVVPPDSAKGGPGGRSRRPGHSRPMPSSPTSAAKGALSSSKRHATYSGSSQMHILDRPRTGRYGVAAIEPLEGQTDAAGQNEPGLTSAYPSTIPVGSANQSFHEVEMFDVRMVDPRLLNSTKILSTEPEMSPSGTFVQLESPKSQPFQIINASPYDLSPTVHSFPIRDYDADNLSYPSIHSNTFQVESTPCEAFRATATEDSPARPRKASFSILRACTASGSWTHCSGRNLRENRREKRILTDQVTPRVDYTAEDGTMVLATGRSLDELLDYGKAEELTNSSSVEQIKVSLVDGTGVREDRLEGNINSAGVGQDDTTAPSDSLVAELDATQAIVDINQLFHPYELDDEPRKVDTTPRHLSKQAFHEQIYALFCNWGIRRLILLALSTMMFILCRLLRLEYVFWM